MTDKITKDMTVNDSIRLYPSIMGVFNDFKLDSCCGGAASIEEASERDGANLDELLTALNKAANT